MITLEDRPDTTAGWLANSHSIALASRQVWEMEMMAAEAILT